MRSLLVVLVGFSFLYAPLSYSQENQINRQNRTIEVVVNETVRVDPDLAYVTLGCISHGETHDEDYQANLKVADKVI